MPLLKSNLTLSILALLLFGCGNAIHAQQLLSKADAAKETLVNNYGIKIAGNNVRVAENNTKREANGYLPTVDANGGISASYGSSSFKFRNGFDQSNPLSSSASADGSIQANYTIIDKVRDSQLSQLYASRDLSELLKRQTVENTLVQLFNSYYEIARQTSNLRVRAETIALSRRRLQQAQYRFDYGQGLRLDVLNAEVDIQRDSINFLNSQRQLANAKRDLNVLMGRSVSQNFQVDTTVAYRNNWQLEALVAQAKKENVGMLLNEQDRIVSELDLEIIEAGKKPRLAANATYSGRYTRYDQQAAIEVQSNQGLNVGLSLNWNLFDGGARKVRRQNTRINLENQLLERRQLEQEITRDVTNAWESYQTALYVLEAEAASLATNQLNLERTQEQFSAGQVTSIAYRQAQLNLITAATNYNNARFDAKIIELQLLQLSGQLLKAVENF